MLRVPISSLQRSGAAGGGGSGVSAWGFLPMAQRDAVDFAFGSPGSEPVPQAPGWHGRGCGGVPAPAVPEDGALRGSGRWIKRNAPWDGQEVKTSLGLSRAYPVLVLKCLWERSPSPAGKGVSSYPPALGRASLQRLV